MHPGKNSKLVLHVLIYNAVSRVNPKNRADADLNFFRASDPV